MARVPFNAMQVIEAAVRLGGFTQAANELGLTQSAVSNAVRRFERDHGVALFERRAGGVQPSRRALELAQATAAANHLLRDALGRLEAAAGVESLMIEISPTLSSRWLAQRLAALEAQVAPHDVMVSSRVSMKDGADIWVRHSRTGRWPNLQTTRLLAETKAPVASPKLVGGDLSDAEVLDLPLIGVDARPEEWRRWAAQAGLPGAPSPSLTFDVTSTAWDAAASGSGVALGDVSLLRRELEAGDLVCLGETRLSDYSYWVCRRRGDHRRPVERAWRWFRDQRAGVGG